MSGDFCVSFVGDLYHNATPGGRGLKLWNESGTNRARIGDSPPMRLRSPQYLAWTLYGGTRSSFGWSDKRRNRDDFLKVGDAAESNQKRARVNRIHVCSLAPLAGRGSGGGGVFPSSDSKFWLAETPPHPKPSASTSPRARGEVKKRQFVLATRGGVAWVMNWVASSMAVPSGVGTAIRNGTRMRVPATGAKATSMLRCAVRYLITARSGM